MPRKASKITHRVVQPEAGIDEQAHSLFGSPHLVGDSLPCGRGSWGNRRADSNGTIFALPGSPKNNNYVPVISSPLKAVNGGNSEGNSPGEDRLEGPSSTHSHTRFSRRRSLQIRIVEPLPEQTLPESSEDSSSSSGGLTGSDQSGPFASTLLRKPSPAVSLRSLGHGFSRYPFRQPSESLVDLVSTSTPSILTPLGMPLDVPVEGLGYGFDTADPERGYSPYISKCGPAIHYPSIDEKEDDDSLHNPDQFDSKHPSIWECYNHCSTRFILTFMCFILLMTGPAILFIVWPIVSYGRLGQHDKQPDEGEKLSPHIYPILGGIRTSLVDLDTPAYAMTRDSVLGQGKLKLVFSDEFNVDGRTFYEGEDQFWQAVDFHYAATNDLEWYDPDAITTANGTLQIQMEAVKNHGMDYRSGMLQSWNKMCFKGGVMEVSASLAGPAGVPGLWPGIWTLGNLARPGYQATSDGVWPYSYNRCDVGITPNQSSFDGLSFLPGQKLAKCVCNGEAHPSPGKGRGAPEIDALEGTAESNMRVGVVTQSSQVVGLSYP
jgi:hypothetical protein